MGRKKLFIEKNCENCKKPFEARQPSGKPNPKLRFCSRSCAMKYVAPNRPPQVRTPEWNKKISDSMRGSKCYNWRGGVTPWQKQERRKPEYVEWRKAVFERDNYTCVLCNERGGKLQADHIKSWIKYPKLRTDINNGRTLCISCHKKTETYARNLKYQP